MISCSPSCAVLPPRPAGEGCGKTLRPGGIARLIFAACNVSFTNILDPAEWCQLVGEGKIVVSGEVVGQKAKGNFTKKRTSSCSPETVTGIERAVTFMDYGGDLENSTDFDFYNGIQRNPSLYKFGYLTCDGYFYGFIDQFSTEIDVVTEDSNLGSTMWDGTISWQGYDMVKPVYIPNLINYLQHNCSDVPNYAPCATSLVVTYDTDILCGAGGIVLTAQYYVDATYQWYLDPPGLPANAAIAGATGFQYVAEEEGDYTCIITRGSCAPVTTTVVAITSSLPTFAVSPVTIGANTVTINPSGTITDYLYSLVIGNVHYAWLTTNAFTNVPTGVHQAGIQELATGCVAYTEYVQV